jgi:hypothetical protein
MHLRAVSLALRLPKLALRDISHARYNQVAFGAKRTSASMRHYKPSWCSAGLARRQNPAIGDGCTRQCAGHSIISDHAFRNGFEQSEGLRTDQKTAP